MSDRRCDTLAMTISEVLDLERRKLGRTYRQIRASTGLGMGTISAALDGQTAVTATHARLADALGCELRVTVRPKKNGPVPHE